MENWRENGSYIARLKIAGKGGDALAARLFFERVFSAADFHPPGISPRAVVCVRKLRAPLEIRRAGSFTGNPVAVWETGVRRAVENLARGAYRPARETVPPHAACVVFEGRAEMLAALANDWLGGEFAEKWWWRALFPHFGHAQTAAKIWLAAAEYAPSALEILAKTGDVEKFVRRLAPGEVRELLREMIVIFALDKLHSALFERLEKPSPQTVRTPRGKAESSRRRAAGAIAPESRAHAPFPALFSDVNFAELSFEQRCLLETGLLLARAPRLARASAFAGRLKILRLETAAGKAAAAPEAFYVIAENETPKGFKRTPKPETGSLPKERRPVKPPWEKPPPSPDVRKSEKFDEFAGEAATNSQESPAASAEISPAPGKKRRSSAALNMEFEAAPAEPAIEKHAPKARRKADVLSAAAYREPSGESLSEPAEEPAEFVFETRFGGVFYLLNLGLFLGLYRDFTESLRTEIDLDVWDFVALLSSEFLGERIKSDAVWDFLRRAAARETDHEFGREFNSFRDWRASLDWLAAFSAGGEWRWAKTAERLVVRHADGFSVLDVARRGDADRQLENELEIYRRNFSRLVEAAPKSDVSVKPKAWLKNLAEYLRERLYRALNAQNPDDLNKILFERNASVSVSATHLEITFALADLPFEVRLAGIDRDPAWIPAAGKYVYFHYV